jgi:hypothetical protein
MPWCEHCSKFWNPNSIPPDATCPKCGKPVTPGRPVTVAEDDPGEDYTAPWHFKLMVVAIVVYLGWRVVQMIGWVV